MSRKLARALALLIPALAALPAAAQVIVDPKLRNSSVNGKPAVQPNFTSRAVAPWPRLDPGAVLCRTREDLDAHRRAVEARASGEPAPAIGAASCRIVQFQTPIDVVERSTPAATQVRVKDNNATGWTDTWLPAQAPH